MSKFYIVDAKTGKNRGSVVMDLFDDISAEEAYNEVHDNLVRACIEAGGDLREARELLTRALEQLYLLGYDSGFTNSEIEQLVTDINNFLEDTK